MRLYPEIALFVVDVQLRIIDGLRVDAGRPYVGSGVATEVGRTDSGWTACRD